MKSKRVDVGLEFCINLIKDSIYYESISGIRHVKKTKTENGIMKRFNTGKTLAEKAYFLDTENLVIGIPSTRESVSPYQVKLYSMHCGCKNCLHTGKLCSKKFAALIYFAKTVTPNIWLTAK
jgi:hypothetical protein